MIGYISCFIAFILCAVVYIKMVRREVSGTLGLKSIIPVVLGVISPFLTLFFLIGLKIMLGKVFGEPFVISVPNLVLKSLLKAFIGAGFTEEFIKLLLALLSVAVIRPRNVYAYALTFIGVGFGFTALEEVVYGGGNDLLSLARLPGFALHMVFGMIMGVHLGLAKFEKRQGNGGSGMHVLAGLLLPVLWHTVYDAATVDNAGLESENDLALILALVIDIATIVLQFIMLSRFKKKSFDYCRMEF